MAKINANANMAEVVIAPNAGGFGSTVTVDGVDVSRFTTAVDFHIGSDGTTSVDLSHVAVLRFDGEAELGHKVALHYPEEYAVASRHVRRGIAMELRALADRLDADWLVEVTGIDKVAVERVLAS